MKGLLFGGGQESRMCVATSGGLVLIAYMQAVIRVFIDRLTALA